jgi:acyl-CoA thioesterase-2
VDARHFLHLEPTDHPLRWRLPVIPPLTTGGGFLFGGCGLGASIEVLESVTGRPVVWATAQYLSYAMPPSVLDLDLTVAVDGRHTAQARVVGRVEDTEIFTVNGALGRRPLEAAGEWAIRPDVPPPEECPNRLLEDRHEETIMSRVEMRLADARQMVELDGTAGTGRSALWARLAGIETSAATLGILGDWVPFGIGQALGERAGGNSLDNTLRVVQIVPTEWVLLDIRIHAVANGFGHGLVHLWAEDGTLLATASQSVIVRYHADFEERRRRREQPRRP